MVDKKIYKIPNGNFVISDEIGCLLLALPCFNMELNQKCIITEEIKNKIIDKYFKNGNIQASELKSNFALLLLCPVSNILKRKKTYLIESKQSFLGFSGKAVISALMD
ncbi:MAG: hypothetical protein ABIC82_02115 [bacterium]